MGIIKLYIFAQNLTALTFSLCAVKSVAHNFLSLRRKIIMNNTMEVEYVPQKIFDLQLDNLKYRTNIDRERMDDKLASYHGKEFF